MSLKISSLVIYISSVFDVRILLASENQLGPEKTVQWVKALVSHAAGLGETPSPAYGQSCARIMPCALLSVNHTLPTKLAIGKNFSFFGILEMMGERY